MWFSSFLLLQVFATAILATPTVYLIRHGEKPADGDDGLNIKGEQRAQCLREVFGIDSGYDIGKIIVQKPKKSGKRARPFLTVLPLSKDLQLDIDTRCDRDDEDCVASLVSDFKASGSSGNILICWEHKALTDIAQALGNKNPPEYPKESFDLIWSDPYPYTHITSSVSEKCEGLDNEPRD
ncbi:hypothetical protein HYFRA_00006378 [Hymenoscyphus fraxineus]|uniref:Phosphoglycerate mutase family protein n=1 Tax=Hymenoscyphus fraxineus TaxID=746836 RepID=A0A9N9KPJ2_9HELO|nr:hypothetical protein HYFRA_00006378 [Hymenoscyphus fraxineus]